MCNLFIVKKIKVINLLGIVSQHSYRLVNLILKLFKINFHQEIIFSLRKFQRLNKLHILKVPQEHLQFLIYHLVRLQQSKNKKSFKNKLKIKKIFQAQLIKIFQIKLVDSSQNHRVKLMMRQKRIKIKQI